MTELDLEAIEQRCQRATPGDDAIREALQSALRYLNGEWVTARESCRAMCALVAEVHRTADFQSDIEELLAEVRHLQTLVGRREPRPATDNAELLRRYEESGEALRDAEKLAQYVRATVPVGEQSISDAALQTLEAEVRRLRERDAMLSGYVRSFGGDPDAIVEDRKRWADR